MEVGEMKSAMKRFLMGAFLGLAMGWSVGVLPPLENKAEATCWKCAGFTAGGCSEYCLPGQGEYGDCDPNHPSCPDGAVKCVGSCF